MTDKVKEMKENTIYICSYGQTGVPICIDPSHKYCKLKSMKSKKCDFRKVIDYSEYEILSEQLKAKEQECEELNKKVASKDYQLTKNIAFFYGLFKKRGIKMKSLRLANEALEDKLKDKTDKLKVAVDALKAISDDEKIRSIKIEYVR